MKPMQVLLPAFKTFALAALVTLWGANATAQSDWPKAKPVTLVVAFAPGASTDIVARSLTQKLSEITGGNFIDRKSTRLNSSHSQQSRMPSSA